MLSVSDKTGIVDFAQALHALGIKLLSTGGTAKLLAEEGLPVTEVAEVTRFPEMLDGRVKTLHPKVHGGLLARRDLPEHMAALNEHGIDTIDLLVVNLYPFEATVAKAGLHAGRRHREHRHRRPGHGALRGQELEGRGRGYRRRPVRRCAGRTESDRQGSQLTSCALRCRWLRSTALPSTTARSATTCRRVTVRSRSSAESYVPERRLFPGQSNGQFIKVQDLRYGENSHQQAAWYRDLHPAPGSLVTGVQLQGKELSYNNIADADAALGVRQELRRARPASSSSTPTPAAWPWVPMPLEAYDKAYKTDPTRAFGGIIAFNRELDKAAAEAIVKQFVEVLMAPDFTAEALEVFKPKANVRLLKIAAAARRRTDGEGATRSTSSAWAGACWCRPPTTMSCRCADLKVVTTQAADHREGDARPAVRLEGRPSSSSPTPSSTARTA